MNHENQQPGKDVDQWLRGQRDAVLADIAACLDVDTGLREVLIAARHTTVVTDVAAGLDVEGGLAAILPAAPPPAVPPTPTARTALPATTLGRYAVLFARQLPGDRLAARAWLPRQRLRNLQVVADFVARAHDLAEDLARARDVSRDLDRALARVHDLARDVDRARDLARDVDHALARHLDGDLDQAREVAEDVDRARDLAEDADRVRDLGGTIDDAIDEAIEGAIDGADDLALTLASHIDHAIDCVLGHDLAIDFADALARDCDRFRVLVNDLALDPYSDLTIAPVRALAVDLVRALDLLEKSITSMVGADLTAADLTGIPLAGVRWSDETRWPPGWEGRIRRESVAVGPGQWEIRPGVANTDFFVEHPVW